MSRPILHRNSERPIWGARLIAGGGLLVALLAASIVGYGHAIPGVNFCYTSCQITVSAGVANGGSTSSSNAPFTVSFAGSASGGTAPYSWSWNFGDGSSSTQQNPTHTFAQTGSFNVVLTVQDAGGNTGHSTTVSIQVGVQQNSNPTTDTGTLAILVAGVVIAAVVAIAVVLLILQKRKRAQMAAADSGAMAPSAYEAPPVGGYAYSPQPPAQDPTSMEPSAGAGADGAVLPPPPSSDDIPATGATQPPMSPPPPPSSDDIPASPPSTAPSLPQ
ncbi:MAG: PKD domain-containing protein [Euryarchaeota archaeon]|nr:PKD domain-containing protein [Euryarchaeota archaeon]MDE1836396.1 PKD domain-containing protein [Euryarchaeota archaeon]MDE1881675.1 PKD domain-containing protein [Euryarchaeota archaeon]MDE2044144.1 PKD domain-containing protein [Thermoplasmata archaeon]